ncbi:ATP-dependent helicase [Paraburkholderia tagetis]|uniref:DNA 3'-5' helicase n=1 Tax=Paraburkholderia tagetis TaxID=2913261 RepID=A0A9X1RX75_9BURK|nr:ATP-dependent helicase [Paraburkholderia tagetis]MCG5076248.1 UvrD-helicase domain-containing protein [Paraburkholderia tagetis]
MNPFERARTEANKLRQQLLNRCTKGVPNSLELLSSVEDELELCIEKVPAAFAALGGGGAVLKRKECFIYVRNTVSDDEYSYLVAHELGHWKLDADKPELTIADLKALMGSEGTPAAIKVEAYGARERQELQANVFARELLLPRDVAATLWRQGKGPRVIAQALVLPLELVRQQMLDGVLLPKAAQVAPRNLPAPSDDQRLAAEAPERFVNVVAGPGTGKTTTLVHRVKYLIEQQNVDPSRILVLTFTNKAAFELVERLRVAGIQRAADIWAGTFHAFGLEFLRKYHQHYGLDQDVLVADRLHEVTLLVRNLPVVDLQYYLRVEDPYDWLQTVLKCIQRLKEELVSPGEYRQRLKSLDPAPEELQREREDIATLYELHERVLAEAKMVDFVDLVAKPALRIRDDRDSVAEFANHFEHVLVDEYQDVTEAMVMLVRQLAARAKSLWVVGDVRQAIHHWRGASVRSLMKFEHSFKGSGDTSSVRKYSLDSNRRSSQEILDLFSEAGRVHTLQTELPLDEMYAVNGKSSLLPQLISCVEKVDIAEAIVQEILKQNDEGKGIAFRNQAVLCKRSADIEFMSAYLRRHQIPVLHIGELAQRPEVKRLVCLMQLLCEREPRALVGLADIPSFFMPWADIRRLLEFSHGDITWQRGRWRGKTFEGMSEAAAAASENLRVLLAGFDRHTNPWQFVCDLLLERRFVIPHPGDVSLDAQTIRVALWQFAYSVRNGDGDVRQARLSRFLLRQQLRQRIGETYADRELPPEASEMDAIRLLTVHASKGLEFTSVHVGFVDPAFFGSEPPTWGTSESITHLVPPAVLGSSDKEFAFESAIERNNLFYVALSRAKLRLQLYESGVRKPIDRLAQLRACGAKYQFRKFNGSVVASVGKSTPGAIGTQLRRRVSLDEFEAYIRCPLQHHYRYNLGLKREQDTDVSIRARWAVMETLHVVAQGGTTPKDAFAAAWESQQLPPKAKDAGLRRDAVIVCQRGLNILRKNDGLLHESLVARIGEIEVELPWVIERPGSKYHMIRFSTRGATATRDTLRPLLLDLVDRDSRPMVLHTLVAQKEIEVEQSKWLERTGAYKAAVRLGADDRTAKPGRHCGRCAYLGICPVVPV